MGKIIIEAKDLVKTYQNGKGRLVVLDNINIPHSLFPTEESQISQSLSRANEFLKIYNLPYAMIMKKNSVDTAILEQPKTERLVPGIFEDRTKSAKYLVFALNEGTQEKIGQIQKNIFEITQMGKEPIIAVIERRGEVIYYKISKMTFLENKSDLQMKDFKF